MNSEIRLSIESHKITFWEIEEGRIIDCVSFKKSALSKLFKAAQIKMKHIVSATNSKLYLITKTNIENDLLF